jgi:ATP/maltotriose-dependent transcriptional regulator MalT
MDIDDVPDGIESIMDEAEEASRETGTRRASVLVDVARALLVERTGTPGEALDLYRKAYAGTTELGLNRESAAILAGMARIEMRHGEYEEARKHLLGALSISGQGAGSIHLEYHINISMAELCMALGERRRAQKHVGQALEFAAATGNPRFIERAEEMTDRCRGS